MNNSVVLMAGVSAGAGILIAAYVALMYQILRGRKTKKNGHSHTGLLGKSRASRQAERKINQLMSWMKSRKAKELTIVVGVTLLMVGTADKISSVPQNVFIGAVLGFIAIAFIEKIKKNVKRARKLKEVAILFESVEMYSRAGYSLVQALRASKMLTEVITDDVDQCLARWGNNPRVALEKLKDDLDLEESDALILMMMHMETAGARSMQGILKREANNIERMQRMKTEIQISQRPLILVVYRILPMASVIGIIVGSLLFRMYLTLGSMGFMGITLGG